MDASKTGTSSKVTTRDRTPYAPERPRLDFTRVAPGALQAMAGLELFVRQSGLEESLIELVRLRASLMNGCGFCVDMHTKDARLAGESEQRLYAVPVWKEAPFFTTRERAALAWTEALTDVAASGVPHDVYDRAVAEFGEEGLVALTIAIVAINGWNRLNVGFRAPVGQYVAGSVAKMFDAMAAGKGGSTQHAA